jgi:hypothetical protein
LLNLHAAICALRVGERLAHEDLELGATPVDLGAAVTRELLVLDDCDFCESDEDGKVLQRRTSFTAVRYLGVKVVVDEERPGRGHASDGVDEVARNGHYPGSEP